MLNGSLLSFQHKMYCVSVQQDKTIQGRKGFMILHAYLGKEVN